MAHKEKEFQIHNTIVPGPVFLFFSMQESETTVL